MRTKISARGQTVIPASLRASHGFKEGSQLEWESAGPETLVVRKVGSRKKKRWSELGELVRDMDYGLWRQASRDAGKDLVQFLKDERNLD